MFITLAHDYEKFINDDFAKVNNYLDSIYAKPLPKKTKIQIKKVHKQMWVLVIWKNISKINHIYFADILQDMLSIIRTIPLKDVKIINFLIRNITEDFIRLYCCQYGSNIANTRQPNQLFDIIFSKTTDDFLHKNFNSIKNIYKEACQYVHSAKMANNIYQCLKDYEGNENDSIIEKLISNLMQLIKFINNIFLIKYKSTFEKASLESQSFIRDFMNKDDLKVFGY